MKRSPLAPLLFSHITAIHRLQRDWHHREFTIVTYLSHSRRGIAKLQLESKAKASEKNVKKTVFEASNGAITHTQKSSKFSMNLVQKNDNKMAVETHVLQKVNCLLNVALQLEDGHSNLGKEKELVKQDLQAQDTGMACST